MCEFEVSRLYTDEREPKEHIRLGLRFLLRVLGDDSLSDNILPDIVLLAQVEQLPDLRRPLGSPLLGNDRVGQTWDLGRPLLDDLESED